MNTRDLIELGNGVHQYGPSHYPTTRRYAYRVLIARALSLALAADRVGWDRACDAYMRVYEYLIARRAR